jgi:hypothetical protein
MVHLAREQMEKLSRILSRGAIPDPAYRPSPRERRQRSATGTDPTDTSTAWPTPRGRKSALMAKYVWIQFPVLALGLSDRTDFLYHGE